MSEHKTSTGRAEDRLIHADLTAPFRIPQTRGGAAAAWADHTRADPGNPCPRGSDLPNTGGGRHHTPGQDPCSEEAHLLLTTITPAFSVVEHQFHTSTKPEIIRTSGSRLFIGPREFRYTRSRTHARIWAYEDRQRWMIYGTRLENGSIRAIQALGWQDEIEYDLMALRLAL